MLTTNELVTGILITAWVALLSLQIYAFMTPRKVPFLVPVVVASLTGFGIAFVIESFYGALWSTMTAAVAGVYGNWGYLFVVGIVILEVMMGILAWWSWDRDRYIDYTH